MDRHEREYEYVFLREIERLQGALKEIEERTTDQWAETYAKDVRNRGGWDAAAF